MSQRTIYSMDYERALSYCSTSGHVFLLNGSSENRRYNEKRSEKRKEVEAALCPELHKNRSIPFLFSDPVNELQDRKQKPAAAKHKRIPKARKVRSITKETARKIRLKANAFYATREARSFVTLTFIEDITDQKAVTCLKNLFHQWRKEWGVKFNYLWVIERQHQNNGRPHFHIMLSKFVDIKEENNRWLRIQYNAGLKGKSKDGVEYSRFDIEEAITAGHEDMYHRGAGELLNPFSIDKINTVDKLASYLTKYVTKSVKSGDTFDCIVWHCSRGISRLFTSSIVMPELFGEALTEKNSEVRKKDSDQGKAGERRYPQLIRGEGGWCNFVFIINRRYFHQYFYDMDQINRQTLIEDIPPKVEMISELQYHNEYCRDYSDYEIQIAGEGYKNIYKPSLKNDLYIDFSDENFVPRKTLQCLIAYN